MEWRLSDEQESYRDALRGWLGTVASPTAVRAWLDSLDLTAFPARFAADGWLGVGIGEDQGGQGGGLLELALTAEELGRAVAPGSAWLTTALTVPALGSLPETATAWLCPAEEPPAAVDTVSVDGEGRLTGVVTRVLAGAEAAAFVVAVGDPGERELRLVDASAPGVGRVVRPLLDRSRGAADVELRQVPSRLLAGDADAALARAADACAVLVAADALGAGERMLEMAVAYSAQRHQFGVPIGSFQAVKHAAAAIEVDVEAGRSAVYFAAASVAAGLPDSSLHAAAVKAQVTAAMSRAADTALTVHGAIGYTWEHDLHLLYKRARLDEHLAGTPVRWNERIADGLALL